MFIAIIKRQTLQRETGNTTATIPGSHAGVIEVIKVIDFRLYSYTYSDTR